MEMNNAYQIYCILIEIHTPGRSFLSVVEAIDLGTGRKIRTDAYGGVATSLADPTVKAMTLKRGITLIQNKSLRRIHQSVAQIKKDNCN